LTFGNAEDRTYYLDKDPAHVEFKDRLGGMAEKVIVFDYEPNVF